ncbi:MAG: hypothetical protein ACFCU6_14815 [Balneolaceae bacterium]
MNKVEPKVSKKTDLKLLSRDELREFCTDLGLQSYRRDQILALSRKVCLSSGLLMDLLGFIWK